MTCDRLDWMLEQENWYSNVEHPAVFVYVSPLGTDTIENVGFACGNTSRAPKVVQISFNTFDPDEMGRIRKMNLNGEHNDQAPCALGWLRMPANAGVPVSPALCETLHQQ